MLNKDSKFVPEPSPKSPEQPVLIDELKQQREQQLDQFINNHKQSLAGKIWRGNTAQLQAKQGSYLDTGFKELNKALHGHGWPLTSMAEIGLKHNGIGELRLLLPALRALQQKSLQKNIILINPPCLPFAPAWEKEGIQIDYLTIVKTNNIQDTLWSTEQSINADCCASVLVWTGRYHLKNQELRRLQLATEKNQTWNIVLRHSQCLEQSSIAGLRIQIKPSYHCQLTVNILKQPNGWGGQHCELSLHPHYENWRRLPVELLPHPNRTQQIDTARANTVQTNTLQTNSIQKKTKNRKPRLKPGSTNSTKVTLLSSYSALKAVH